MRYDKSIGMKKSIGVPLFADLVSHIRKSRCDDIDKSYNVGVWMKVDGGLELHYSFTYYNGDTYNFTASVWQNMSGWNAQVYDDRQPNEPNGGGSRGKIGTYMTMDEAKAALDEYIKSDIESMEEESGGMEADFDENERIIDLIDDLHFNDYVEFDNGERYFVSSARGDAPHGSLWVTTSKNSDRGWYRPMRDVVRIIEHNEDGERLYYD